ncbi:phage baseplate upper protein, partial [Lactococcus lactis]
MSHKTLNLDLAKTPILKSIVYGRIGDEDMQTVTVKITSRDTPVDLTGFTITFEGVTSGGQTKVFDVDGISSTATGLKAGTFDYTFPNMAFAVAGNYEIAYFSIVKGDKRDTTGEFDIIVDGNADIDAPLAETIITEYNKLVKELHQITDKYVSDSDAKFADLNQKIADLQTKITEYQNTVKNTADTAVSTINTTKDSAVSTINSTKDSAVSTVNSTASSAVKTINDALEEFKKGDFYTKTEADAKFATSQSLTDLSNKVIANKGNLASGTDLDNVIDIGTYRI